MYVSNHSLSFLPTFFLTDWYTGITINSNSEPSKIFDNFPNNSSISSSVLIKNELQFFINSLYLNLLLLSSVFKKSIISYFLLYSSVLKDVKNEFVNKLGFPANIFSSEVTCYV